MPGPSPKSFAAIPAAVKLVALFTATILTGCRSSWYARWADRDAYGTIEEGQRSVLGETFEFDIAYAPVDGREFLVNAESEREDERQLPTMSLDDALKVAFKNSREFQARKEKLYSSGLSLATLSRGWSTLLFGGELDATGVAERKPETEAEGGAWDSNRYIDASGGLSVSKRLVGGGLIVLGASLDYAVDLIDSPSDSDVVGSLVNGSFTQPLLRGAWRNLAYEEQYRRERDFLFEVFEFVRYRQTFAVGIMRDYYNVLRSRDQLENRRTSIERLQQAHAMTRTLVQGGQVSKVQEDQAEQDLLNAQIDLEKTLLTSSSALDAFKITLGLPISTEMRLDYPNALNLLNQQGPKHFPFTEREAVHTALLTDTALMRARAQVRDGARDVEIAADKFRPSLDLELKGGVADSSTNGTLKVEWDRPSREAKVRFHYDLDQTPNRDAYRNALIARDQAARDLAREEDNATLGVRNSFRSLRRSRQSYLLQVKSVAIANRRTTLVALERKEGGLASARDVLEAERARTVALNGLANSLIEYTMTRLDFLADLGMLTVNGDGQITEREQPFGFERLVERYGYLSPSPEIAKERSVAPEPGAEARANDVAETPEKEDADE